MAAGKFNMQKASGGVASITIADGVSNTSVVLPESGTVATTATATETSTGLVELATTAEAQAGTDNLRAITPLKLRNALNATGTAPIYACRAWVNFNGIGTVAIRASGNVSSITDNGTGNYTINFTTAMPDSDYSISGSALSGTTVSAIVSIESPTPYTGTPFQMTTAGVRIGTRNDDGTLADMSWITASIFR